MIKPPYVPDEWGQYSLSSWYGGGTYPTQVTWTRGSWSSNTTPGYKQIPKRSLPWHPHVKEYEKHRELPGSFVVGDAYNTWYLGGEFGAIIPTTFHSRPDGRPWMLAANRISQPSTSGVETLALSKLQGRIAGVKVNLAQAYAERLQTVNLLRASVSRVVTAAMLLKRGRLVEAHRFFQKHVPNFTPPLPGGRRSTEGGGRKAVRTFSSLWLEYQYGWRPLLGDVFGVAELLAQTHVGPRPLRFSAKAEDQQEIVAPFRTLSWYNAQMDQWINCTEQTRCNYVVEVLEDPSVLTALASTGMTNPALLAWELVPYSFVVDWFLPLGDYLEQLEYARGLTFYRGTKSVSTSLRATSFGRTTSAGSGTTVYSASGAGLSVEQDTHVRSVLSGFPYQEFPKFQPKLGVTRILSGIALLAGIFDRKISRYR